MTGILPDATAGALVTRDSSGNPTNPAGVQNAYVPAPAFVSDCPLTALPSDCTARIEAKQINAIVSELMAFAECMDPDGPWSCSSLTNLCAAFTAWRISSGAVVDGVSIVGSGTIGSPYHVGLIDCGSY